MQTMPAQLYQSSIFSAGSNSRQDYVISHKSHVCKRWILLNLGGETPTIIVLIGKFITLISKYGNRM